MSDLGFNNLASFEFWISLIALFVMIL